MAWRTRCDDLMETLNNLTEVVGRQAETMRNMGEHLQQAAQGQGTPAQVPVAAVP